MKVELQCGDTITIPEGCKAIVKDGSVVFEKEEKEKVQEFKDGDILVSTANGIRHNAFIYKVEDKKGSHSYYIGIDICGQLSFDKYLSCRWGNYDLSYATEEEKQLLFDKMEEQGLKWNAEEKRVEKIRWRAKSGKCYFSFSGTTFNLCCYTECFAKDDINLYNCGNYFRTQEQTAEAAKRVKETLRKYHEEIGE